MPLNSSRRDHFCLRYLLVYREHKMRTHKIYFWWLRRNIFIETDLFECFKNHLWALLLLDPSKSKRSPIKTQKIFFLINLLFLCANGICERKSLFVFFYIYLRRRREFWKQTSKKNAENEDMNANVCEAADSCGGATLCVRGKKTWIEFIFYVASKHNIWMKSKRQFRNDIK